ncbi:hypothetical protein FBR05_00390 [Deltaproteobacteria bacterium PRO3]|nr:hypothetical protein [Deltaproteobacteria bacterium PRO3]
MEILNTQEAAKLLRYRNVKSFRDALPSLIAAGMPAKRMGLGARARWRFVKEKLEAWVAEDRGFDLRSSLVPGKNQERKTG